MKRKSWTRREFVGVGTTFVSASILRPSLGMTPWHQFPSLPRSQGDSPEVISGGLRPLLESNVARPLRYKAEGGAFVIHNGKEFFNRPLYGPNIPFRVDGGDLPEFSLYLPGHGGNLRLGIVTASGAKWLSHADHVVARYVAGRLLYEIHDSWLGAGGIVHVEALTEGAGLWVEVRSDGLAATTSLTWAFGGVSGRKGKRNGDIGCEIEPVSQFFQVRPAECRGNSWTIKNNEAEVQSEKIRLRLTGPQDASLRAFDAVYWDAPWHQIWPSAETAIEPELPALAGKVGLGKSTLRLHVEVLEGAVLPSSANGSTQPVRHRLAERRAQLTHTATAMSWSTPDAFLDGTAAALGIAADAIWDETQGCVMHGAVAWRNPLAGWRGPYALDVTGRHDRMRSHLRHWIAKQNTTPVTNGLGGEPTPNGFTSIMEATGNPDKGSANTRSEGLLHSNGDLSHNHYDMNLVFFDALFRHLRWTGDIAFAREVWPALVRHAAWERRLFRRQYGSNEKSQPLYEAYAAIWASDNLQYSGGGAAHSSAYNVFLNRRMAEIAEMLGEDSAVSGAYRAEAEAIADAMRRLLWMPERGAFAESKNWLGNQGLLESPAVWTVYHTVDSEVTSRKEAWQMAADRLAAIRKVPIIGADVPAGGWQMACSDWMPYVWSLTLLVLAENLHMALALFQAGMAQDAYGLLYGSLIDAGYRGLCPGNFPMSLQLDPHRQESQRDFGDPIGCASRALVEGLWGIRPDLLAGQLNLRPQLPRSWKHGRFDHPELTLSYLRADMHEHWEIQHLLPKPVGLRLEVQALTVELPEVIVNGRVTSSMFVSDAVGSPTVLIQSSPASSWKVEIRWKGKPPVSASEDALPCDIGQKILWPKEIGDAIVDDPQKCLENGVAKSPGPHTVFVLIQTGDCRYWLPLRLNIGTRETSHSIPTSHNQKESFETVSIDSLLTGQVSEILSRSHTRPRSPFCSLNLPEGLLGGWANFNVKAEITDEGLRNAGGELQIANGLKFRTPSDSQIPNCCFLSHWVNDLPTLNVSLNGRARAVYVLLACTTFPQATRSLHGVAQVKYANTTFDLEVELRSPHNWWPVEQDYLIDDYVFRMERHGATERPLPMRIDLKTGQAREVERKTFKEKYAAVHGGSATVLRIEVDPLQALEGLKLECKLSGVVMGILAITLGRPL
jgi:hypothetical protein